MSRPVAAPGAPPASGVSPVIHLVDDDEAVRQALALLIGTVGLRVQPWAHPQAFLDGFDRQSVGAIVLDVRMPGLSGLMVLEQLRQQGVDQPVVMLTGHGMPSRIQGGGGRVPREAGGRRGPARSPAQRGARTRAHAPAGGRGP